ncbi:excinuclease ABC subunit UvrC [candidate division WOR-3 bacterium]|nr:excinuclease ABC subunit UvrC [candidate division WOR-3 bacterium]
MKNRDKLKETALNAPDQPGVYIFRGKEGTPLYIGKAKSLKKRVISYFKDKAAKNVYLINQSNALDFLVLLSEEEALILEADLIKFHKPKYNVLLKDDKRFPYIRIDLNEKWPIPEVVRNVKKDGAKYFGPYLKPNSLRTALYESRRHFKFRSCRGVLPSKECLDYHIGLCSAPCSEKISKRDYSDSMSAFADFLAGGVRKLIKKYEKLMAEYADKTEYEKAAKTRDMIEHLKNVLFGEREVFNDGRNRDLIGFAKRGKKGCFFVMQVREGRLHEAFPVMTSLPAETDSDEAMGRFLVDFYRSRQAPEIVLLSTNPADKKIIEEWLFRTHGSKTLIKRSRRIFEKEKIEEITKIAHGKLIQVKKGVPPLLRDFAVALKLEEPPVVMYSFDVSHTAFKEIKGSQICFKNALPHKSFYRQYDIPEGLDDLKAMNQMISRFAKHVAVGEFLRPDLLLIDGGTEQLKAALSALKERNLEVKVISISKRLETLHFPDGSAMSLPVHSPVLILLRRMRDESHRFGVKSHRNKRSKKIFDSSFTKIPGVGEKTARELRKKFKGIEELRKSSVEEIAKTTGLGEKKAAAIFDFLNV